jgi:uncharacterized protein (TIRG00374 family)
VKVFRIRDEGWITKSLYSGAVAQVNRRRSIITAVIGLIIMVAVFAFLFPQFANYGQAFEQLQRLNPWWVLALLAASVVNIWVYPWTAKAALPELTYGQSFVSRQSGFLMSNILPGGGAVAVGTQYAILARYGVKPGAAASAVSADAVWTYLMTLATPALAVLLLVLEGRSTAGYLTIAIVGFLLVLVSIFLLWLVLRSETGARMVAGWLQTPTNWVFRLIRKPAPDLSTVLVNFSTTAHDLVVQRWPQLTVTNVGAQLGPFLVLFVSLWALDAFPQPLSVVEIFAAYSIAILLVSFPITPGGLGTVDAALVALLVAFGVDSATAVAADLIWRLVWFLPQLLIGIGTFSWFSWSRRRDLARSTPGASY